MSWTNPRFVCLLGLALLGVQARQLLVFGTDESIRDVPPTHPRLFGSQDELQMLARARPQAYARMATVARRGGAGDHSQMMSMALVAAIEGDAELGRRCRELAMKYVEGPMCSTMATASRWPNTKWPRAWPSTTITSLA